MIIIHYLNVYYNRLGWKQPKYRRRSYRKCIRKVRIIYKELIERAIVLLFLLFMDHLTQSAHVSECVIRFDAATLCEFIFVDFICICVMCMRHMLIDYILLVPYCRQYIFLWIFFFFKFLNCPKIKWIIRWLYVFKKTNF